MKTPNDLKLPACNGFALRQATRCVSAVYERHIAKAGLTSSQFSILTALRNSPHIAIQDLAEHLVMERTSLVRSIQLLVRDGLVRQQPSPLHARKQVLSLSDAGAAKLIEARVHWDAAQAEFETAIGADQAQALRAALFALTRAFAGAVGDESHKANDAA
jgi:DNA-binding MarR family transcriptional regulator